MEGFGYNITNYILGFYWRVTLLCHHFPKAFLYWADIAACKFGWESAILTWCKQGILMWLDSLDIGFPDNFFLGGEGDVVVAVGILFSRFVADSAYVPGPTAPLKGELKKGGVNAAWLWWYGMIVLDWKNRAFKSIGLVEDDCVFGEEKTVTEVGEWCANDVSDSSDSSSNSLAEHLGVSTFITLLNAE